MQRERAQPGITITEQPGSIRVVVSGEIDMATAATFQQCTDQAFAGEGGSSVVIDLSDCDYIDSSGLRILNRAARLSADGQRTLTVVGARGIVRRVIQLTNLDEVLTLED
jgi:anti-sigma B factor antagonist